MATEETTSSPDVSSTPSEADVAETQPSRASASDAPRTSAADSSGGLELPSRTGPEGFPRRAEAPPGLKAHQEKLGRLLNPPTPRTRHVKEHSSRET